MVILGFMLNYALRVNLTIAIGKNLKYTKKVEGSNENFVFFSVAMVPGNTTSASIAKMNTNATTVSPEIVTIEDDSNIVDQSTFDWSESEKQLILGSFFWGYIMTELPGGRLAELIGGHRVFGHSSKLKFLIFSNGN